MALNPQNRGKTTKLPVHPDFGSLTETRVNPVTGKPMPPTAADKGIRVVRQGKRTMFRFPKKLDREV